MKNKILAALGISCLILVSCKKDYDDLMQESLAKKDYVPVFVEEVDKIRDEIPIHAIGRVASDSEIRLSFKTGGYIKSMRAEEGSYVKKGRLLAQLRTEEIDSQVLKARQAVQKAKRDLDRVTAMYEDSVATYEAVQNLTTQVEVTEADLRIASYNQEYSTIISPISGRILQKFSEPNELVSPGQPIFMIASSKGGSYVVNVDLSDKDIGLINLRTSAKVTFDAFPGKEFRGSVIKIGESADLRTGTFKIKIAVDQRGSRLRHGMIGKVTLLPGSSSSFVKIPLESVAEGEGDMVTIYTPSSSDTIAKSHQLYVARYGDDYVLLEKASFDADRVITSGSAYLQDGQRIKIINPKAE